MNKKEEKLKQDVIKTISEHFENKHYELYKIVKKLNKKQKNKLKKLAKNYFKIDKNQKLDLDIRFAYYQIIEDCFKILKDTDEMLFKNIKFCNTGGDNIE